MSELLRAVMTERCLYSRPKFYQILSPIETEPVPAGGVVLSGNVQIQSNTYFMCMAVCLTEGQNTNFQSNTYNIQGVADPSQRNAQLSIVDVDTSYAHQNFPIQIQCTNWGMNSITDLDEYFIVEGSHVVQATVTAQPYQNGTLTSRQWATTLVGIEFKFAKPINIHDYQMLALAYRPPPLPKHADFYPLLSGA